MPKKEFTNEPEDLSLLALWELEERYSDAVKNTHNIQVQLSDRDKRSADGKRMSSVEYHTWRRRAVIALRHAQDKQAELKQALKDARRRFNRDGPLNLDSADDLLHASWVLLAQIASSGVWTPSKDEQATMTALRNYLQDSSMVPAKGQKL